MVINPVEFAEMMILEIETYSGKWDKEILSLILSIQNDEAKIGLSLQEQPDLLDIHRSYQQPGGQFWIALSDGKVVGTIGLLLKDDHCAVLKKFFVKKEFRSQKVGLSLYRELLAYAIGKGVRCIFWIRLQLRKHRIIFMRKQAFAKSVPRNYPYRILIPTETAFFIY